MEWATAGLEFSKYPEKVVRGTLVSLVSRIIKRSPVDTGRFRGNWQASFNTMALGQTGTIEPVDVTIKKAQNKANQLEMGATFFLTNNLPYSLRLEYGWSDQAPSGMVRLEVAQLQARMNEADKKV